MFNLASIRSLYSPKKLLVDPLTVHFGCSHNAQSSRLPETRSPLVITNVDTESVSQIVLGWSRDPLALNFVDNRLMLICKPKQLW